MKIKKFEGYTVPYPQPPPEPRRFKTFDKDDFDDIFRRWIRML